MLEQLTLNGQKITFDRDATVALYLETIVKPGADQCGCIYCKNFAAQRDTVFPAEFLELLARLGINPAQEWEAFDFDHASLNPKERLYGGWFLFVGELLEGLDLQGARTHDKFVYWFTESFPNGTLPEGVNFGAVEFLTRTPWVLSEAP